MKLLLITLLVETAFGAQLGPTLYEWKTMDFVWPSDSHRTKAIESGDYIPENVIPHKMKIWKNKMFVTTPRFKPGVPSTLNYIDLTISNKSQPLIPYPTWEANMYNSFEEGIHHHHHYTQPRHRDFLIEDPKNHRLISASQVSVDNKCDRLFVLDRMKVGPQSDDIPPAIVIIDLFEDVVIDTYVLPQDVVSPHSNFFNFIVDTSKGCENTMVYLADGYGHQLVVFSLASRKSWKVYHYFFHFDPTKVDLYERKANVQWAVGLRSLALVNETLHFNALASNFDFSVSTRTVQTPHHNVMSTEYYRKYKIEGYKGNNTQNVGYTYDANNNVLFFGEILQNGIACWNLANTLNSDNHVIVLRDNERLLYPGSLAVNRGSDEDRDYLYILSNRYIEYSVGMWDPKDVNFRIFKQATSELVRMTRCAPR